MRAVRIHHFGGPEALTLDDIAIPAPAPGEILVSVRATSINPVDYKTREGHYPPVHAESLPIVLGRDISGTVEALGANVGDFEVGEPVFAMLPPDRGGYAEFVTLKAADAAPLPRSLNFAAAASVPLAALTAWQGLFDHGGLRRGERVLIHGGAGGVGHFAIQFAKWRGCMVYTTVSGRDQAFVRGIGADEAIDYRNQRFEEHVLDADLVLDLVGGDTLRRSFDVLKFGGRLVSTLGDPDPGLCEDRGVRGMRYMASPNAAQLREIAQLIDDKKVRPIVSVMLPLSEVRTGQEILAHEHPFGKLVLQMVG